MVGVACVTPHAPPLSYPTPSVNPPLPPSRPSSHPPPLGPAASQSSSCRPKALRHPSQHTLRLACMQTTSLVCPVVLRRADGPLLAAVRSGAWVLLDELNLAGQTVLEGLNAVLDHRAEVGRAGGAGGRGGGGGSGWRGGGPGGSIILADVRPGPVVWRVCPVCAAQAVPVCPVCSVQAMPTDTPPPPPGPPSLHPQVFIPELNRTFRCPPTFRVFGAQNPLQAGQGRAGQGWAAAGGLSVA